MPGYNFHFQEKKPDFVYYPLINHNHTSTIRISDKAGVGTCHGMSLQVTIDCTVGTRHGVSPPHGVSKTANQSGWPVSGSGSIII
jgi:hypothetical protein